MQIELLLGREQAERTARERGREAGLAEYVSARVKRRSNSPSLTQTAPQLHPKHLQFPLRLPQSHLRSSHTRFQLFTLHNLVRVQANYSFHGLVVLLSHYWFMLVPAQNSSSAVLFHTLTRLIAMRMVHKFIEGVRESALIPKAAGRRTAPAVLHKHTSTSLALVVALIHITPPVLAAVVKDTLAVLTVGVRAGPGLVGHWVEGQGNSGGEEVVEGDVAAWRVGFGGHEGEQTARGAGELVGFQHIALTYDDWAGEGLSLALKCEELVKELGQLGGFPRRLGAISLQLAVFWVFLP